MTVETLGRAVSLYRQTAASRSAIVLLIANAIPIVGVLFFGWSLITILVLFWVENGIVGFWNVPKIALARASMLSSLPDLPGAAARLATRSPEQAASLQAAWKEAQAARQAEMLAGAGPTVGTPAPGTMGTLSMLAGSGLAIFFVVHYGIFWVVHGVFVFALPAFGSFGLGSDCVGFPPGVEVPLPGLGQCEPGAFGEVLWGPIAIAAIALFLSHGASFLFNYVGRAEYIRATPGGQMMAPYARVIVLHITIIVGAFVIALIGAPIGALLVLVLLKTAFDLGLHLREHRKSGPLPTA